jgi:hypothetical protein
MNIQNQTRKKKKNQNLYFCLQSARKLIYVSVFSTFFRAFIPRPPFDTDTEMNEGKERREMIGSGGKDERMEKGKRTGDWKKWEGKKEQQ